MTDDGPAFHARRPFPAGRTRWLAGGASAAGAGLLGLLLAAQVGASPACAAPPAGGGTNQGKATFYDAQGQGGNCSFDSAPADRMYVALGPDEYADAAACGGYLDVTGPRGTVRVVVMDQCPECAAGHLDLSREAFARIADPVRGIVDVSYRAVVDPPTGPLAVRVKEGASQWWFAVRVTDHGNPLATVEARTGSGWRGLVRHDYNYWLADDGLGPGPYSLRVTDVYGNRTTVPGVQLAPGRTQRTDVRLYGSGSGSSSGSRSAGSSSAADGSGDRPPPAQATAAAEPPSPGPTPTGSASPGPSPTAGAAGLGAAASPSTVPAAAAAEPPSVCG
ncbi:expansin EXLX1 family cellulose-binding protein [Solwaraspora sp. WMMA2080]|uniref:expansin EXLX1 family cellulose-binding protein n=1 Tax=unclassified Solwaraspora TaxID=2627926 RepID=UPI00248D1DB5|nr:MULTISPECIES: expansin EXLX1 family cellulose-binding protein [unclassified Solwaraspora]WBB98216.1 expansin EXLX1 family cellulose-binding protein [Solwaraspora sp. WMMA2059]WBC23230.1 expansin EXLX1 family cellulose-binding protein [Solwaraspora sp. WMMA2080]